MPHLLTRIPAEGATAAGLLRAEHFQMAYVTTDLDRACALFTERLGVRAFAPLGGPMAAGGQLQARFAWVGTLMYEIICASGPGAEIYREGLPADGRFAIRHHHLGFLVHDRAQFDAALAAALGHGWTVPYRSSNALVEACFVRVPELEHFLEYLLPTPAGLEFFAGVPRS